LSEHRAGQTPNPGPERNPRFVRNQRPTKWSLFVFNSRVLFGTIAVAGLLGASAVPALAATTGKAHHGKTTDVVGAVTAPLKTVTGTLGGIAGGALGATPLGGLLGSVPTGGLLDGITSIPLVGPLIESLEGGMSSAAPGGSPVTSVLKGSPDLSDVVGQISSTVSGAASTATGALKSVPVIGQLTSALPGVSSITGALSGITNVVPDVSSVTSALPGSAG
jgi:hypothetical protein